MAQLKAAIIGGGAWGTGLAAAVARAGTDTILWAREEEVVQHINEQHQNPIFLKGVRLPDSLRATHQLQHIFDRDVIFVVTPSQFLRATLSQLKALGLPTHIPLVLCCKGVEKNSLLLMHEVAEAVVKNPLAALSGPTFADETGKGLPTSAVLACRKKKIAKNIIAPCLESESFKLFYTKDMVGAEISGAVKNVIAIACGIAEGKQLGNNAKAALITRGLKEIQALCKRKGGKSVTLLELCGVGDLVLTCSSLNSRNMSLGFALGQGKPLDEILGERMSVAEGVASAESVVALAKKLKLRLPICEAVYKIVHGKANIDTTIAALIRES